MKLAHDRARPEGAQRRPFRKLLVASAIIGGVILTGGALLERAHIREIRDKENRAVYLPKLEEKACESEAKWLWGLAGSASYEFNERLATPGDSLTPSAQAIGWRMEIDSNSNGMEGERTRRITGILNDFRVELLEEYRWEIPERNRKKDSLFALYSMVKTRDDSWLTYSDQFGPGPGCSRPGSCLK